MTSLAVVFVAAMTWFPAVDWVERPDPVASPRARRGGTIRFCGARPPKSINAYIGNDLCSTVTFDILYERLLGMDRTTGELVPELARRWAVSDDGREFTFVLDERAKWSDGVPVTAADVKWTFDAVVAPESDTGQWKPTLSIFESPEIVDPRTIRFRKRGASPRDWRDILNCAMFWVFPKHAFAGRDFNRLNIVGTATSGAYEIVRAEPQVETELRRHGRWWRQDAPPCRNKMNFDRILFRYFAEGENGYEALKRRNLDVYPVHVAHLYDADASSRPFVRNWLLRRRIRNRAPIGFDGLAMNQRRPPFDDVRVRKAMAALLDREMMNRTMMNGANLILRSYYSDLYDEAHPCTNESTAYDPVRAARLLREAGWARDPSDGLLKRGGRPFAFAFLSRSASDDGILSVFNQELRAQGITMTVVRKDFASWMRDLDSFAFDMTRIAWGATAVKYFDQFWSSAEADRSGSSNITGFRSPEVDRLIAAEKGMNRAEDRCAAYRRMDALIAAETPYALLWQSDSTRLIYWNKFGMPEGVLPPAGREESVLTYWWYDPDRAQELKRAMREGGFLPDVML